MTRDPSPEPPRAAAGDAEDAAEFERVGAPRPRGWLIAAAVVVAGLVAALAALVVAVDDADDDELPIGELQGAPDRDAPADDEAPVDGEALQGAAPDEAPADFDQLAEAETSWEALTTPPEPLSSPVVVTSDADAVAGAGLNEEALVLGGRTDADDTAQTLALAPDRETWQRRGRIPLAEVVEAWRDDDHLIAFGRDAGGAYAAARAHPRGHGWERLPDPPPGEHDALGMLDGELWLLPAYVLPREAPAETDAAVLSPDAERWRSEPTPFAPTTAGPSSVRVDDQLVAVSRTPDEDVSSQPAWARLDPDEGWSEAAPVPSRPSGWTPRIVPWAEGGGLILGPAPEGAQTSAAWEWDATGAISRTLKVDPPLEWWRVEVLPAGEQLVLAPAARYAQGYRATELGRPWQRLEAPPRDVGWHEGAVASTGDGVLAVGDADTIDEPGAAWLPLP